MNTEFSLETVLTPHRDIHYMPKVSVVIPARNEAKNLPFVFSRLPTGLHEVIVVDGHSVDDTIEVAKELYPTVKIVMQKGKGKGNALQEGFAAATGDIIVMLDADGSTDPAEIPAYVGALRVGADFAKGSRFLQGGGTSDMEFHRKLGNMAFVYLVRFLFGGHYTDLCYGYNAFWARVLPWIDLDVDGFEVETLMNVRVLHAGLKVTEVPSFEDTRIHGISNLKAIPDGFRVLKTIFAEWLRRPNLRALEGGQGRDQVNQDEFTPAMELLFEEAHQLFRKRHDLAPDVYRMALDTIKHAYTELLKMETTSSHARRLQTRYKKYYDVNALWAFLESALPPENGVK